MKFYLQDTRFNFYRQKTSLDCGEAALKMIAKHFERLDMFVEKIENQKHLAFGATAESIKRSSNLLGIGCICVLITAEKLVNDVPLPCILHWNGNHFVVLWKIEKNRENCKTIFKIADPAVGFFNLDEIEFASNWKEESDKGAVIIFFVDKTPLTR